MVFTLHWYIFRDLVKTFLLATTVLCLVLGLGSMLRPLRDFSIDPIRVPELLLCTLPVTLTLVIPIAALFAATISYGRLAVDNEITACRSSGINILTVAYPAAALALLVGTATLLLDFHVIPSFARRIETIVKSDAEAIIYRNIEKKGDLGNLLPGYQIHADRALPDEHRLIGVALIRLDRNRQVERIITAEQVSVQFENTAEQNRIRLQLHKWTAFEGDVTASMEDNVISIPIPSFLRDEIKFKNLEELKAIRADMLRYREVSNLMDDVRYQFMVENYFSWCDGEFRKKGYADFNRPGGRIRVFAGSCQWQFNAKKKTGNSSSRKVAEFVGAKDQPVRVEVYYDNQPNKPQKYYQAQRCRIILNPQLLSQRAVLNLDTVRWHYADESQQFNLASYDFPELIIPRDTTAKSENLTLSGVLADEAKLLPEQSTYLSGMCKKLRKVCSDLLLDINIELHSRLAFGVCCVALVLLGAGLGIVFRSGHLLTSFGISCIPASICLITIFTGKHIAQQNGVNPGMGIAFLWSGIVFIMACNIFLFRFLMRR